MSSTKYSPDSLLDALNAMPPCAGVVVGLSGGLDSVVLLHSLATLQQQKRFTLPVRALHINHGLNPLAATWQSHCETLCQQLHIPCKSLSLELTAYRAADGVAPSGVENAARNGRYEVFAQQLAHNEALLLAHHRDDQMETVLLRLLRGAGPRGLAGMPRMRPVGKGFLYRPLLDVDWQALQAYADQQQLTWVEDESNTDTHFDRNYCRHTLLPLIAERWPGYRDSWSKSTALQREADILLQDLARLDLAQLQTGARNELQLDGLRQLSKPRQRNVLRCWLDSYALPEPGWHDLHHLVDAVIPAATDAAAVWHGDHYWVSCFKNTLVLLQVTPDIDTQTQHVWNPLQDPVLPLTDNGALLARPCNDDEQHMGLAVPGVLQVRYRQGGERCRLRGRPGKSLKKILQEQGIAPWLRERLPLLYAGDELLYVPGIGAAEHADSQSRSKDSPLYVISWQQPDLAPQ